MQGGWIIGNGESSTPPITSGSTIYPPYIEESINIFTELDTNGFTFTVCSCWGFGFSPTGTTVEIQNFVPYNFSNIIDNQLVSFKVKSFFEIELTLRVKKYKSSGEKIKITTPNGNSEQWGVRYLKINPKVKTQGFANGWWDFRSYQPANIVTSANYNQSSYDFSNSGLVQNITEGLTRNSVNYTNFMGIFYSLGVPVFSPLSLEFILKFSSGSFVIGCGFGTIDANWNKSIRENCASMISLENRAYSKAYFGKGSNYFGQEYVTGYNWNNSFVHVMFGYFPDENKTLVKIYSRATLSYDWNIADDGEFITEFTQSNIDTSRRGTAYLEEDNKLCPYIEIRNSSSTGYIVAMKLA